MQVSHKIDAIKLSEELLEAVRKKKPTFIVESVLKNIELEELKLQLYNDRRRKAFWINIYNAYYQIHIEDYKHEKLMIFSKRIIEIANHKFSLDDIEHGILRKLNFKYGLGYVPLLFADKVIKELAVEKLDYRIHFALNCGAKSCPPI
ncbi:DUF547 domain-containing protein [Flammeovirga yaeyamensis]|uniref:DUF547 domain-containing protein n=1 Tax=Flammeovirga yaeyamensis TaxID=367791 RepID=A0AAX1NFY4_9BACT|nr:DUF547 domain-containing protein [Flammeovirga yaeyamensis]MBB3696738.1 hypothetical protein [Flammeovirga yaeyamensis]NMF33408.1 DUF547 domain-containing protein [Flammeovirga yaeyamensis]QWG05318.1 DUF547 domain-containing protein [Flammeovirga yaeyamensis]